MVLMPRPKGSEMPCAALNLPERLAAAQAKHGLTPARMAALFGVSERTYRRWKKGHLKFFKAAQLYRLEFLERTAVASEYDSDPI